MKTIKLLIELTYDEDMMHGEDPESIRWFRFAGGVYRLAREGQW